MNRHKAISIPMADLSPEAATALSDWLFNLAHEVDSHYGDLIRSYQLRLDQEEAEIEEEIACLRDERNESQQALPF